MALKFLLGRRPGEVTPVKTLCDELGAPFDPMAKVLQSLSHAGVLKSEKGAQGGYLIIKDLKKVSYFELNEILMGPVEVIKCLKASSPCELMDTCNIQSPLTVLNEKVIGFYKSISLHEILAPSSKEGLAELNVDRLGEAAEKWS